VTRLRERSRAGGLVELVLIVATALALALGIQAFLIKPYRIPSESMEPTLDVGQRVLVNRIGNRFTDPKVGEIMVFHPPKGAVTSGVQCGNPSQGQGHPQPCGTATRQKASENFIKRVVAGPGDTVAIVEGGVVRNGKRVKETFIRKCLKGSSDCNFRTPIRIPPGHWFMMGDNRGSSDDSRFWGPVPKSWIVGGAFATYWPPGRIGLL
jgi:signal peptidase I